MVVAVGERLGERPGVEEPGERGLEVGEAAAQVGEPLVGHGGLHLECGLADDDLAEPAHAHGRSRAALTPDEAHEAREEEGGGLAAVLLAGGDDGGRRLAELGAPAEPPEGALENHGGAEALGGLDEPRLEHLILEEAAALSGAHDDDDALVGLEVLDEARDPVGDAFGNVLLRGLGGRGLLLLGAVLAAAARLAVLGPNTWTR